MNISFVLFPQKIINAPARCGHVPQNQWFPTLSIVGTIPQPVDSPAFWSVFGMMGTISTTLTVIEMSSLIGRTTIFIHF